MAITNAVRVNPVLGPSLIANETSFWFSPPETYLNGAVSDNPGVSYPVGTRVMGTDAHEYMLVKNTTGGNLAASARFDVADSTFALTASGTGAWMVPADVKAGPVPANAYFHARKFDL